MIAFPEKLQDETEEQYKLRCEVWAKESSLERNGYENNNVLRIAEGLPLKEKNLIAEKKPEEENNGTILNEFIEFKYKRNGEVSEAKVKIDELAEDLINKFHFKTICGKAYDKIYYFNGKYYEPTGREKIKAIAESILKSYARNNIINELVEKVKRKTICNKEIFEDLDCNLINFENGVYNLSKQKLLKHSPDYNFTHIIPHQFDKEQNCIKFKKFCEDILYPEDIPLMQEIFGFQLYRKYFLKYGFIFRGAKDTSKTTLLNAMIQFIGQENKTSIPLQKISGGSDFTKLSLKDKHLNVYDDLSAKDLTDTAGFKIATGGGYISAEEKFGDYNQFMSYAKQVFATNKIPPIKENDEAYFGRWIVIEFDNVIENPNPFILKEILTESEMSGIINWALEGLNRLLTNFKFSYEKSLEQTKLIMERSGSSISAFVQDCLIENEAGKITKEQMYEMYSWYVNKENLPKLSKEQLGRQLLKKANYILDKRDSERYWSNVSLNVFGKYYDTLDTFKNTIRVMEKSNIAIDNIISKNVSNPSKIEENNLKLKDDDTLDTFLKEDEQNLNIKEESKLSKCFFCEKPVNLEELSDLEGHKACKECLEQYNLNLSQEIKCEAPQECF